MSLSAERTPVIVGVGEHNDRPENPADGLNSLDLMEMALLAADNDGGGGWLADLESLATVRQLSCPQIDNIAGSLAGRLGAVAADARETERPSGTNPVLLLNEAANRIGSGEIKVAAVAGGEAFRTAAFRARSAHAGKKPEGDAIARSAASMASPLRVRYGMIEPVDVYPLYENAGRAAYGQSLAEGQDETGEIWSRFAEVAEQTEGAWFRKGVSADEIKTLSPDNRAIAHPYSKLMVANSSVNQGAGFIVTSLAEARRRGVADEKLICVGNGAAAKEDDDPLKRDRYDRSVSMIVSIRAALELNGLSGADLDHVELYSCFPCVPKMARRILDWPVERPATVFGGLTFGGGPLGNYMSHAVVNMVRKLRDGGSYGLLFANGGYATLNHTIVLSSAPIERASFPQDFRFQADAEKQRDPVPALLEEYAGPATIETFTVLYDRAGKVRFGIVVARTPNDERTLAKVPSDDLDGIGFLTEGSAEPVGSDGRIVTDEAGNNIWQRIGS